MSILKKIFLSFLMVVFLMHSADAFAACECAEMSLNTAIQDSEMMPCHGIDNGEQQAADQGQESEDSEQANCMKCGCGHCKVPSQAILLTDPTASQFVTRNDLSLLAKNMLFATPTFGIENPPKQIS